MKKIIFSIICVISLFSCKETNKEETQLVETTQRQDDTVNCQPSIIIDKALLGAGYQAWHQRYGTLVCDTQNNDILVDLSKITSDATNEKKAAWLKENGNHINYTKSKTLLLNSHDIPSQEIDSIINETTVTVGQIKNIITPAVYTNDRYVNYLYVTFSPSFSMSTTGFNKNGGSFSIPFLRALLDGMNNLENIKFADALVTENGGQVRTILIKKGNVSFNYSKWPTKDI